MATKDERDVTSTTTRKITAYPFEDTLLEIAALAEQRQREKETDLQRRAMHIGSLFLAVSEEAGPNGRYGTRTPDKVAELIRPYVVVALDWLQEHGHPVRAEASSSALTALLELIARGGIPNSFSVEPLVPEVRSTDQQDQTLLATAQPFVLDITMQQDLGIDDSDIL